MRFLQRVPACYRDLLLFHAAYCLGVFACNAAHHYQGHSHVRKPLRTYNRHLESNWEVLFQIVFLNGHVHCFLLCVDSVQDQLSSSSILKRSVLCSILLFQWWLWLWCCTGRCHGLFNACTAERPSRKLWMTTRNKSTASHIQVQMQPILATRACWSLHCADCGSTSRVSEPSHRVSCCWEVFTLHMLKARKTIV